MDAEYSAHFTRMGYATGRWGGRGEELSGRIFGGHDGSA